MLPVALTYPVMSAPDDENTTTFEVPLIEIFALPLVVLFAVLCYVWPALLMQGRLARLLHPMEMAHRLQKK